MLDSIPKATSETTGPTEIHFFGAAAGHAGQTREQCTCSLTQEQKKAKHLQRITRMATDGITNETLGYKPQGRSQWGNPPKRWKHQFT
jgi:hypothetical protein